MNRISTHVIETKSRDFLRSAIDGFYENGDALFREISERDYGIDGLVELFDNGEPTGQIAMVQIKGTANRIVPLKRQDVVSCSISTANALYARQDVIPVLLIYVSIEKPETFYFADIHTALNEIDLQKIQEQDSITVHNPLDNNIVDDLEPFFETIRTFYRRGRK